MPLTKSAAPAATRSALPDAFQFAHQSWNGDAVLVARVVAFTGTNGTGKAGLMFAPASSLAP